MSNATQQFVPGSILLVGVLLISGVREQHTVKSVQPIASIPAHFADMDGRDQVIGEQERRVAGMSDYTLRQFGPESSPVFSVYVGYYERQVQGKTIHSPKNCLPGAGWDILSSQRVPTPGGTQGATVNRVLLANKGVRALVYYWYQGRGRTEASEYKVKWNLLRDAALYGRTEEALVRIVVPLSRATSKEGYLDSDPDIQRADRLARQVAIELEPAVQRVLPNSPA